MYRRRVVSYLKMREIVAKWEPFQQSPPSLMGMDGWMDASG